MNWKSTTNITLFVGFAVFGAWQTLQIQTLEAQLAALQSPHNNWNQDYQQLADNLNKNIQQLQDKNSQLAAAKTQSTTLITNNQSSQVGALANPTPANIHRIDPRDSPDYQRALADRTVLATYGRFIASLKLSPDKEGQLKTRLAEMIANELAKNRDLSQRVANGELTSDEARVQAMGISPAVIMAQYLNSEQMDAFRAYEADLPNRNNASLANLTYMQMQTEAPGLTEASRVLIAATYADEVLNPAKNLGAGFQSASLAAYQRVETSLHGILSDDQMRSAVEFLRTRANMERALRESGN